MYSLLKNSQEVLVSEFLRPIKMQPNGFYALCTEEEKDGYNADNVIILNDQFDSVSSFDGSQQLLKTSQLARDQVKQLSVSTNTPPSAQMGELYHGTEEWVPNKAYSQYDIFSYNGSLGFVKQAHTSQSHWIPFTAGTESLYGARPIPNEQGVYTYTYNMAVEVDQLVYDPEDQNTYKCIQATQDLLWAPHSVPALFQKISEEELY